VLRKTRHVKRVDFIPDAPAEVLEYMSQLSRAGDGWINLTPKIEGNEESKPLGFFTLFGGGSTGVTMCTWIPKSDDPSGRDQIRLGITHNTGLRAVAQLQSVAFPIPENWGVEQDHPRRGLVLNVPSDEPNERVLAWAIGAGGSLSRAGRVGAWRAEVHLP
jgi:hypothetical protein